MPIVLSHRANLVGPCPSSENSSSAVKAALTSGFGIETDIRRADDGRFYMSHDKQPSPDGRLAADFCALFRAHPNATIALNIKEPESEQALIEFLDEAHVLDQIFLFDMELVESTPGDMARRFRHLHPDLRLAARVSDRGEPIERALAIDVASIIWLDEFDRPWCTRQDIHRLKDAGRTVFAVSPELHDPLHPDVHHRWMDFIRWGVDGICTDYPAALARVLKSFEQDTAA